MPKLLKILTGPQEGAELELDAGIALRMGTDDSCDIAIVDAMAPAQALEVVLEGDDVFVTAAAERIFAGDAALPVGEKTTLPDYTILTIGSTRCAIGDADKPWPPLRWIPLDVLLAEKPEAKEEEKPQEQTPEQTEEAPLSREQVEKLDELQSKQRAKRSRGFAIISWLLLILICAAGMWFTGRYVWKIAAPKEKEEAKDIAENAHKTRLERLPKESSQTFVKLVEEAVKYFPENAKLSNLVKWKDPEMTDDETLARSVKELVWGLTEGRLQLVSLKDRVARLMGMTNSEEEWNTIVDNIRHDVPRLASVESDVVYADVMAAKLREALAKTGFQDVRVEILPGELQFVGYAPKESRPKESSQTFVKLVEEAVKYFPENAKLSNLVKWKDSKTAIEGEEPVEPKARQLPITGIVVHPYPCVILADGQRLGPGSQVGGYTIDEISLTEVSLSRNEEKLN